MINKRKNQKLGSKKIARRDFICKSALFCCIANIPFAATGFSKKVAQEEKKSDVNPIELAGYCGLYCGACDIYQQRISQSGSELKNVLDAYGFNEIAKQVPGLEDYETFYKVLDNIITIFGQCPGCQKGGGDPQCEVRRCCREKGYKSCAECPSAPCETLKNYVGSYSNWMENFQEIKKIGLKQWCKKQQEKVNKGFRYSDTLTKKSKAEN